MPIVYEITALYRRTVQPKDYESATAEIGMKAQLEEKDDIDAVAAQLLTNCRDLTLKAVTGKRIDGKSLKELVGKTKGEVEVKAVEATGRGISDTPDDRGEALPGDDGEADAAAEKKRLAAEKRKATAAKKKAAADAAAAAEEVDLPGVEDDGGDYDASAFEDEDAGAEVISTTDLQHFITGSVSDKKITVLVAKEIMSQFGDGAGRVKDIPEGSRNTVHEEIKKAIAE